MKRVVGATRYLVMIPIAGLLLAAAALFVIGGAGLILTIINLAIEALFGSAAHGSEQLPVEVEIVEYVHRFLIGTVLFITAAGFYQLFIDKAQFPEWLKIDSTEELETNLVGVTVVVLAVNFMGVVFTRSAEDLLHYGLGVAAVIAALALFIGLRTWSTSHAKKTERAMAFVAEHSGDMALDPADRQDLATVDE
jgi:uncharacterized membrane protein YqhA